MFHIETRWSWVLLCLITLTVAAQLGAKPVVATSASVQAALDTGFQGLGWSADGKFAWLEGLDPGMAAPMVFLRVAIIDTVEDTILYDQVIDFDPNATDGPADRALAASGDFKEFQRHLERFDIQSATAAQLQIAAFPYAYQGGQLTARVAAKTTDEEGDGFSPTKSWSLWVDSSLKGSKRIAGNTEPMMDIQVEGWLRSPFEKRLLVIALITRRVLEGDSSTKRVFSGCYLESGFARK